MTAIGSVMRMVTHLARSRGAGGLSTMRTYETTFDVDAQPIQVLATPREPESWLTSLPSVASLARVADGDGSGIGRCFAVDIQAALRYHLRWRMETIDVDPRSITWRATGDLEGVGTCNIRHHDLGTRIQAEWSVRANRPWMVLLWPMAHRVFARNHDMVMERGIRHLRAHLAR